MSDNFDTNILKKIKFKEDYVQYEFDAFKIRIPQDSYNKYKLEVDKAYSKEELASIFIDEEIFKINKYINKEIKKRLYSTNAIKRRVYKKFGKTELSKSIINNRIEDGSINDEMYIKEYLEYFNYSNYGKYYILNFFKKEGIRNEILKNIEFSEEIEELKCIKYFEQIKNKYVSSNFTKQKRKIFNLLLRNGFEITVINKVISGLKIDSNEEYQKLIKDYNKLKFKYSSRFVGRKLKNKIINCLINNGYSYTIVNELLEEMGEEDTDD